MKAIFKIILALLFVSTSNFTLAQTFSDDSSKADIVGFNTANSQQNFLSSQNNTANTSANSASQQDNTVFISQIGDGNTVISTTSSSTSDISYVQVGDSNLASIDVRSENVKETISQIGNNNTIIDSNAFRNQTHNVEVNQNGNNQNLSVYGTNSITEKLKVSMQGQNQTIIVRSFN